MKLENKFMRLKATVIKGDMEKLNSKLKTAEDNLVILNF
jgi:hypothetical protein